MKIRRKQRTSKAHGILWALFACGMSVLFIGVMAAIGIFMQGDEWLEDLPGISEEEIMRENQESTVYAADGTTVLAKFRLQNRTPLDSLDQISNYVVKGTVATEDERFYDHNGVDLMGIVRAALVNVFGGELEGASTITQQLVRNTLISSEANDISFKRKVREIKLSLDVEEMYSKDQILLMYLNTINYGSGCYGIQAASTYYFSKNANELTLAEAATLIGIPQSPTYLNPVEYPDACKDRRNIVLSRMLSAGIIDRSEYEAACAEPITLNVSVDESINGIYLYPYFTSYVRDTLLETYSSAELYEGGWSIYTTLDVTSQEAAETACAAQYNKMADGLEVSMVSIDPNTGAITSIVGGKDFTEDQFNIATQKGRPTGSTFKVFTLVTAIKQGINPETLVDCTSPMEVDDGAATVENFEGSNMGILSIRDALAYSSNTGFVRLQQQVTAQEVIKTAWDMGVTQTELPEVTTLTLGVADVTPLDMASAYGTLATYGIHYEAYAIESIVDKTGQTVFQHQSNGTRVLTESVAGAAVDVMRGVFTYGTAEGYSLAGGRQVAGKTGTSEDYKDHWTIGFTPQVVCAVWIGDRQNEMEQRNVSASGVFKQFMDIVLGDTEKAYFSDYTDPDYENPYNDEQNKKLRDPSGAPDTAGMTLEAAQAALEDYTVSVVQEKSTTVASGTVIEQTISDRTIILHVSMGP